MEQRRLRLRGTSVLAAPLAVVSVMGLALGLACVLWTASGGHALTPAIVASIAVPTVLGLLALAAIRGCFVEIAPGPDGSGGVVRDVAGWFTVRRIDRDDVVTARVRRGIWRLYVLETADGNVFKLVGASPQQFPAHLLPDARVHDGEDLDALLGSDPAPPEH